MHPGETLLLGARIGRNLYGGWRLRRALSALITVVMLAVIAAILICALVIGAIYIACLSLLHNGIAPPVIFLIAALLVLLIIFLIFAAIYWRVQSLKSSGASRASAVVDRAGEVVDAFLDGLLFDRG